MNQKKQILLNLQREIEAITGETSPEIEKWWSIAGCAISSPKYEKCEKCQHLFKCSRLSHWNDISHKELLRKS